MEQGRSRCQPRMARHWLQGQADLQGFARIAGLGSSPLPAPALAGVSNLDRSNDNDHQICWIAYHYGHTDDGGNAFIRLLPGDVAHDTVWINNATGGYSLTDPWEAAKKMAAERRAAIEAFDND